MRDLKQMNQMRIVYQLPGMDQVPARKDIVYKTVEGEDLKMDIYYPLDMQPKSIHPAVILVHGGSQPEHAEHINEAQPFVSWSQLIAASDLIAVMFKHRTDEGYSKLYEAGSDIDDLVHHVRSNGTSYLYQTLDTSAGFLYHLINTDGNDVVCKPEGTSYGSKLHHSRDRAILIVGAWDHRI